MLADEGIISEEDAAAIREGLQQVRAEIEAGEFQWNTALEDVHMNIEHRLTELIGAAGGRLHTARSRNDQVATDLRLWLMRFIDGFYRDSTHCKRRCSNSPNEMARPFYPGIPTFNVRSRFCWDTIYSPMSK